MKKISILAVLFVFIACNVSFAAALASGGTTTTTGLQVFGGVDADDAAGSSSVLLGKMSKGVYFGAAYTTGGYACATKHTSGSKAYGTAHDSTAIYFQDIGTAALSTVTPSAASNTAFGSAWTAM
ncbi:hypothetical protein [Desulfuromonas sp. TF]|uniref:hypothetical protein n=1 Tax=Desulfuromonas sp. TF TaxID=1232410 RepID=UPI000487F354|nr:hypothetical protein [Desulfuromonas sp. TF]